MGDRRGERDRERLRAELASECVPTIDAAGDRPGEGTLGRDLLQSSGPKEIDGGRERCAAARVESVELLRLRVPDDGEEVAADPTGHRLDHAEYGVGCDGSVDCIASVL